MALGRRLVIALGVAFLVTSCAKAQEQSHLYAQDLTPPENAPEFDRDKIISLEELTDSTVTGDVLRAFLTYRVVDKTRKSPYGHESFLSSYYSNGLSAVDALLNAAEQYRINPLVLLARVEMAQGLVGMEFYPTDDPARVEYVFRCGCSGPGVCDPAYAGFDHQVDCLARQYRIILDDMDANGGVTAGGWSKGKDGRTIDGKVVTPVDDGTAAAYQFDPVVGDARTGNQLFWTIWVNYVKAAGYQASAGPTTGAWIGDPCSKDAQCKAIGPDAVCITSYEGGMCSIPCRPTCPTREGRESACIDVGSGLGAYCFQRCVVAASSTCRGGSSAWSCCAANVYPPAPGVTQAVCLYLPPGSQRCQ